MPYQIQEITESDFPALVRCMWYTYEHPLQHLFRIFAPENATGCQTREESIEESIKRFWEWHVSDPSSHWIKVVDTDDENKIVAGALWKINKTNPCEDEHDEEAYWHPAGGQREFANQVLKQHEAGRARMARRPHIYLNILLTHPSYQRRGIGTKILQWGTAKAGQMGLEMWLNAWSDDARRLYERHGFVVVDHHVTKPEREGSDEDWDRCKREWTDLEEWVMWRPKDGESGRPWEA